MKTLLAAIAALLVAPALASASVPANYLPLDPGRTWFYDGDRGTDHFMTMGGPRVVMGTTTRVRHEESSGIIEDVFENYWSTNAEGDLFLHGAANVDAGLAWVYDPPVLMLDAPLEVGKTWSSDFTVCEGFGSGPCIEQLSVSFLVTSEGTISVPSGTFGTFAVKEVGVVPNVAPTTTEDRFTLFGRRLPDDHTASERGLESWYADGIGIVRTEEDGETLDLVLTNPPTPAVESTWGEIKSLYR